MTFELTKAEEIALALEPHHVCSSEARDLQGALRRAVWEIYLLSRAANARPFVLDALEVEACNLGHSKYTPGWRMAMALDRAVRTLGPQAQEPLTTEERKAADQLIEAHEEAFMRGADKGGLLIPFYCANVLRSFFGSRFPKSKPESKADVLSRRFSRHKLTGDELDALDELVALAKGKP